MPLYLEDVPGRGHADCDGGVAGERSERRVGRHSAHALRDARAAHQEQLRQHIRGRDSHAAAHQCHAFHA